MISNWLIIILSISSLFVVAYLIIGFTKTIKREKEVDEPKAKDELLKEDILKEKQKT